MSQAAIKQSIMITRPAHQAKGLTQGIQSQGGDVFLFPTLDIQPSEPSPQNDKLIAHINQFNMIIFISPNAVEHGINKITATSNLSESVLLATIGQGSAKALEAKLGKPADIVPKKNFNSEGLLLTNEMQNVEGKHILIIRGNGGREHLKQELEKRGAVVEYLTAYQRIKPQQKSDKLEQYLQNNLIAAIVITSAESLKNLLEMSPGKVTKQLLHVPLLLINQRLVSIANEIGFNSKLIVADEASDESIIHSLKQNNLI